MLVLDFDVWRMGERYLKVIFGVLPEFPSGVSFIEGDARNDNIVNAMLIHECLDIKFVLVTLGVDDWQSRMVGHVGLNAFGPGHLGVLFDLVFKAVADLSGVMAEQAQLAKEIDVGLVTS